MKKILWGIFGVITILIIMGVFYIALRNNHPEELQKELFMSVRNIEISPGSKIYINNSNSNCWSNLYVEKIQSNNAGFPEVILSYAPGGGVHILQGENQSFSEKTFMWYKNISIPAVGSCKESELTPQQIKIEVLSIDLTNKKAEIRILES